MSMLNFFINPAGKNLCASGRQILERAKDELRQVFDPQISIGRRLLPEYSDGLNFRTHVLRA
jgi:hypothetical protein